MALVTSKLYKIRQHMLRVILSILTYNVYIAFRHQWKPMKRRAAGSGSHFIDVKCTPVNHDKVPLQTVWRFKQVVYWYYYKHSLTLQQKLLHCYSVGIMLQIHPWRNTHSRCHLAVLNRKKIPYLLDQNLLENFQINKPLSLLPLTRLCMSSPPRI